MEQIIGKLSEIETTAESIMKDAAQKKKALSAEGGPERCDRGDCAGGIYGKLWINVG